MMQMTILGSGSSGNSSIVRFGSRSIMIDAGLGPRTVARRLAGLGGDTHDIDALLLTHLDSDHFKPNWLPHLMQRSIRVYLHRRHIHRFYEAGESEARLLHKAGLLTEIGEQPFELSLRDGEKLIVRPVLALHDRTGSVAYRIESVRGRMTFATDMGRVSDKLIAAMTDVDMLAIESNYDPQMQIASPRPPLLKQRIMGGKGHLSNEQCYQAVCQAVARSQKPPRHVVLLHLSRQCNAPHIPQQLYDANPLMTGRVWISSQTTPTPWLKIDNEGRLLPGEQMRMFA